jgi:hypothetical protein
MMKLGIRTGKARTPQETSASPGEGSGGHQQLPGREREREHGRASQRENLVLVGGGHPYLPRHAADPVEEPLDSSELSTELRRGRHQR